MALLPHSSLMGTECLWSPLRVFFLMLHMVFSCSFSKLCIIYHYKLLIMNKSQIHCIQNLSFAVPSYLMFSILSWNKSWWINNVQYPTHNFLGEVVMGGHRQIPVNQLRLFLQHLLVVWTRTFKTFKNKHIEFWLVRVN